MAVRRPNNGPPGEGSFTWRGKHSNATAAARGEFLRLVAELAPDVVSSLYSGVRPTFSRLIVEQGWAVADAISSREEDPLAVLKRKSEEATSAPPFLEALSRWSSRWNLRAPWVDRWVLSTLHTWWQANPHVPARPSADSSSPPPTTWPLEYGELIYSPNFKPPQLRSFQPAHETQQSYAAYAREALAAYMQAIEQEAQTRGMVPWPKKRARNGPPDRHLRWLVRFQVLEENQEALADSEEVGRRTLQDGIEQARMLIGLEARKSRRRRPRRTRP